MFTATRDQENSFHHEGPSAAQPQPKMQSLFHRRGSEFAEFGVLFDQTLFTPRPPRLRGEISFESIQYLEQGSNDAE